MLLWWSVALNKPASNNPGDRNRLRNQLPQALRCTVTRTNPCSDGSKHVRLIASPESHTLRAQGGPTRTRSTGYLRRGKLNEKEIIRGGVNRALGSGGPGKAGTACEREVPERRGPRTGRPLPPTHPGAVPGRREGKRAMESGEEQPTLSLKALTRSGAPGKPPGHGRSPGRLRAGRPLCDSAVTCRGPSSEAAGCAPTGSEPGQVCGAVRRVR